MEIDNTAVEKNDQEAATDQATNNTQNQEDDFYKQELEKLQAENAKILEERDNYKEGLLSLKQRNKERIKQQEDFGYRDDEDVLAKVEEKLTNIKQETVQTAVASILASMSSNSDERKLILHHFNNSIKRTGDSTENILSDLETARFLANRRKNEREITELKRVIENPISSASQAAGSNIDRYSPGKSIALSDHEKVILNRRAQLAGVSLDEYIKRVKI